MENPIKMDDVGVPLFSETPLLFFFPVFREPTEDVNAFNERLKEVLFNEQSGILETWSRLGPRCPMEC